ncbi:MAG: WG repeat-containing protein [Planctomycetota bacterium]
MDKTGKMVIPQRFSTANNFSEGLAWVYTNLDDDGGYIDKTGKMVIKVDCVVAGDFSEGLAWVEIDNKYGYIDRTGKIVIEPQFDDAHSSYSNFSEGLAGVTIRGNSCYIDKTGKIIINLKSNMRCSPFSGGLAKVETRGLYRQLAGRIGKIGYIDKTGKYVWEPTE